MDTFTLVNHSALDNTMAEFAFHAENGVKYLQFGLLNSEDAGYITELEPYLYRLEVGFIKDKLVRDTVRITDTYNENLGFPIDRIPELTLGDEYEIGFNKLEDDREQGGGLTTTQLNQITTAIQGISIPDGITPEQWTALINAIKNIAIDQALIDKINGIEDNATEDQTAEEIRDALLGLANGWLPVSAIKGLNMTEIELKVDAVFPIGGTVSPFFMEYIPQLDQVWMTLNNDVIETYRLSGAYSSNFQILQIASSRSPRGILYQDAADQIGFIDRTAANDISVVRYNRSRAFVTETTLAGYPSNANINGAVYIRNSEIQSIWIFFEDTGGQGEFSIARYNGAYSHQDNMEAVGKWYKGGCYVSRLDEVWILSGQNSGAGESEIRRFTPGGGYIGSIDNPFEDRHDNPHGMTYIPDPVDKLWVGDITDDKIYQYDILQYVA